jgi:hypothetical protein
MGEKRTACRGYWWEIQEEGIHYEDQDIDGWAILKWILER